MFDRLITGGSIKKKKEAGVGSGDWQGSWSHYAEIWDHVPGSAGWPSLSRGLPKSSITRNFISLLKCGLRVVLEAAEMIRIWPDWTVWASVLSHCYHQLLLSFIDLAGREWLAMFEMEACSPERCQHWARSNTRACFLCQGRQLMHIPLQTPFWF